MNGNRTDLRWTMTGLLVICLPTLPGCARGPVSRLLSAPAAPDSRPATRAVAATEPRPAVDLTLDALKTEGPHGHHVPSGLVYESQDALWQVRPDGERVRMLEPLRGIPWMRPKPALSPDSTQALYEEAGDVWLAEIATGEQTVAYDLAGRPWLYGAYTGAKPLAFDLARYEPGSEPPIAIVNPAWSPAGSRLAWIVGGDFAALGGWRLALGTLDLETDTVSLYHPYEPVSRGGFPSAPVWSPDGRWLVSVVWDEEGDEAGTWVTQADGEQEHQVNRERSWVWSPDGRWLAWTVIPPHDRDGLVEVGTWQAQRLHLPLDARLVGWNDPDAGDR